MGRLTVMIEEKPLPKNQQWLDLLMWVDQNYAEWPYIFIIAFLENIEKHVEQLTAKKEKAAVLKAVADLNKRLPHSNMSAFLFPKTWEINRQKNSTATLYQSYDSLMKSNSFEIKIQNTYIVGHVLPQQAIGFKLSDNVRENASVLYSFIPKDTKGIIELNEKWEGSKLLFYYLLAYQKLYNHLKPFDLSLQIRWSDQKERLKPSDEQLNAVIQEITRDNDIQTLFQLNNHP